jgi:hypothetical protein
MRSVTVLIAIVAALGVVPACHAAMSFLDNGVIRLGVDLDKGGTITYLSTSLVISGLGAVNVVNSHDLGREVQQSYYSGPDNFVIPPPPFAPLPWNPEGAGDGNPWGPAHPATVLAQSNDGLTIYTKTAPFIWATDRVLCECLIEQWITLDGNSVQVHNRLTNFRSDHTNYGPWGQELPAVITNGTFWRLFTYSGNSPYTGGPLTEIINSGPPLAWAEFRATEHWAAHVNDSGFGVGIFNAFVTHFIGGFHGTPNIGGPNDDPVGYIAPNIDEILDWNIVYEYDYTLVLGTLDQIRTFAVAHRPDDRPDYQFARDRQHFWLVNATDAGWPISGALHINLNQNDPSIIGPEQWWQATDMPRLYITAAYHTSGTSANVFWSTPGWLPGQRFSGEHSVGFTVIPDGQFHTYTVDLASSPTYQGTIAGIRFDPSDGNDPNGYVDIAAITWRSPSTFVNLNQHGLTGSWYEGATSGQGVEVEVFPDALSGMGSTFVGWFTYDSVIGGAERQRWYSAQGPMVTGQPSASLTIYQNTGGNFNAPPVTNPQAVGTATMRFDTCSSGQLSYQFTDDTGRTGAIPLTRLTQNVTCSTTTPYPTNADFALSGTWFDGATSGQGFVAEVNPNSRVLFLAWYTYVPNGTSSGAAGQRWYSAQGNFTTGMRSIPVTIYETTGGLFDAPTPPGQKTVAVGSGTMEFQSCSAATFDYNFTAGSSIGLSGSITLSRVGPVPPGCAS